MDAIGKMAPEHRDHESEWNTRARIRFATGDAAGAVAAWKEMYKPVNRFPWTRPVTENLALYDLARAEEAAGDADAARRDLHELLRRWGAADLPIASVAEARTMLARLGEGPVRTSAGSANP